MGRCECGTARPSARRSAAGAEARGLVRFHQARADSAADLRDRIRRDATVSDEVRARALDLVASDRGPADVRGASDAPSPDPALPADPFAP